MAVTARKPNGEGPKYAWLQTPKGKAYTKRNYANGGAARQAAYRERHGEEYLRAHREGERRRRTTPEGKRAKKNAHLMYLYGMTLDAFEALAAAQDGKCGICARALDMGFHTAVDHDHKIGRIRGLLCSRCNTALGSFKEDESILRRAITYLTEKGH